uniref:Integrase core domain containing protein n=1 Tax=Panagrellus redivivus TaxID=6233 RepID=A0A7E4V4D8_PANRE
MQDQGIGDEDGPAFFDNVINIQDGVPCRAKRKSIEDPSPQPIYESEDTEDKHLPYCPFVDSFIISDVELITDFGTGIAEIVVLETCLTDVVQVIDGCQGGNTSFEAVRKLSPRDLITFIGEESSHDGGGD